MLCIVSSHSLVHHTSRQFLHTFLAVLGVGCGCKNKSAMGRTVNNKRTAFLFLGVVSRSQILRPSHVWTPESELPCPRPAPSTTPKRGNDLLHLCPLAPCLFTKRVLQLRVSHNLPTFSTDIQFGLLIWVVIPLGNVVRVGEVHAKNINFGKVWIRGRPINTVTMSSNINKRQSAIIILDAEEVTCLEQLASRCSFHP